ncbi:peptidyl-prolyl cis-trans isomerase [Deinococcus budaensis]|uniref:peptidylprolyl isomerase n=1 Tax=Deinococcus budaensis TaxID=1665626 RepID=A0A7W8GGL5_9DEIO|nr:peptidyl-prolyl cis-trans isomerase C [Deinococcus budaensis]
MKNKKVVNVLLGVLALMLVVGMAYQFTPDVGSLFGNRQQGTPALKVNGQTVTVEELEALRRSNPVLTSAESGVLADDFKTYVVAQQARQVLLTQAAGDIDVSRADVNAEVQKVREANQLTETKAWTDALQGVGLTDAEFRRRTRDQLAVDRKIEEIKKTAQPATDAEARLHYDLNPEGFQTDARIVGRQIVVGDKAKAERLLAEVKGGADFAALASANSTEFKDRGGALGPIENGAPRPVAQVALPGEVGAAAFALTGGGVTDVVESGGKFYIVKVERFLAPGVRPFEQAKAEAVTAVNEQKKNAAVERWLTGLEKDLKIEVLDPNWKTENPAVATVAGQTIPYSDVVSQVVQNQQFAGLLGQVPPEQAAQLVNGLLKPQVVTGLIQSYAAPTIAGREELALTGTRQDIAQGLAAYGARDVKVTDADIQAYYQQNREQFQTPAGGTVAEASFADRAAAQAFRQGWNGQGSFTAAAGKAGGTVSERGQVAPGTPDAPGPLDPAVEAAVFTAQNLRSAGEGSLSDVVKVGDRFVVAYVTDLQRAAVQPLSAVREQIRQQVLATKKQEAGQAYVAKQVETLKPVNNLQKVLDAQQKRVAAAAPPPATQPKAGEGTDTGAPADAAGAPATTPDADTAAESGEGSAAPATPGGTSDR